MEHPLPLPRTEEPPWQLDGAIGEIRFPVVMAERLAKHCHSSFIDFELSLSLQGCLSACFCLSVSLSAFAH